MKQSEFTRCTAYHEAGHAVVIWACSRAVGPITTQPRDGEQGSVLHGEHGELLIEHLHPWGDEWWVELDDGKFRKATPTELRIFDLTNELADMEHEEIDVLICAAGEIAQGRIGYGSEGCDFDKEEAAFKVPDADRREALYARVQSLFDDPLIWGAVTAVAEALIAQHELDGGEAVHIIHRSMQTLS